MFLFCCVFSKKKAETMGQEKIRLALEAQRDLMERLTVAEVKARLNEQIGLQKGEVKAWKQSQKEQAQRSRQEQADKGVEVWFAIWATFHRAQPRHCIATQAQAQLKTVRFPFVAFAAG